MAWSNSKKVYIVDVDITYYWTKQFWVCAEIVSREEGMFGKKAWTELQKHHSTILLIFSKHYFYLNIWGVYSARLHTNFQQNVEQLLLHSTHSQIVITTLAGVSNAVVNRITIKMDEKAIRPNCSKKM